MYILDIYNGDGVEGESPTPAGYNRRAAMRAAKALARSKWDNVSIVTPADDDIISYGPRKGAEHDDAYITVRRV